MSKHITIGKYAEEIAKDYLAEKGYKIIERNYRKPWGEIDIVAKNGDVFLFVEVKANSVESREFAPETRVDKKRIGRIIRTAQTYLSSTGNKNISWQVDIISVTFFKKEGRAKIVYFKNVADNYI